MLGEHEAKLWDHTPGASGACYRSCSSVDNRTCCTQCVGELCVCEETPSQVTELHWQSGQTHYHGDVRDLLQIRSLFFFIYVSCSFFAISLLSLHVRLWHTRRVARAWFCRYRKDGQYHCETYISCVFIYRKSIQLNAISKVTLLVQDPMWFLNDLLMAFKVRGKNTDD